MSDRGIDCSNGSTAFINADIQHAPMFKELFINNNNKAFLVPSSGVQVLVGALAAKQLLLLLYVLNVPHHSRNKSFCIYIYGI